MWKLTQRVIIFFIRSSLSIFTKKNLIMGAFVLLIISLCSMFYLYNQTKKENIELENKVIAVETKLNEIDEMFKQQVRETEKVMMLQGILEEHVLVLQQEVSEVTKDFTSIKEDLDSEVSLILNDDTSYEYQSYPEYTFSFSKEPIEVTTVDNKPKAKPAKPAPKRQLSQEASNRVSSARVDAMWRSYYGK